MVSAQAVEDLRQPQGTTLRYIGDLRETLTTVETLTAGREPVVSARLPGAWMASAGRCRRASLLVPGRQGALRTVAHLT